jgi:phosphoglycolate phosphatase
VLEICAALGVPPDRTWLIGDTPTDVATARAAGAHVIAAAWGFRTREELAASGADFIAERPEQVREVVLAGSTQAHTERSRPNRRSGAGSAGPDYGTR